MYVLNWLFSQQTACASLETRSEPVLELSQERNHSPRVASTDANDGDRGAGEANEGIDVLHDDADGGEDARGSRVARLLDGLAALDGTGAAAAGRARPASGSRGGGGKDCESGEGDELGKHCGCGALEKSCRTM